MCCRFLVPFQTPTFVLRMERNYYVRPNFRRYEQLLSPFGNKVLSVLIKHWDKARFQNNNENELRQFPAQNKRVLTFNDDSVVHSRYTPTLVLPTPITHCKQVQLEEKAFNFSFEDKTVPDVPKSVSLLKAVPNNNDKKDSFYLAIETNKNPIVNVSNKHYDDDMLLVEEPHTGNNTSKSKDINWDDMLDSELLVNTNATEEETNVNKTIVMTFPNENVTSSKIKRNNMSTGAKRKITIKAEPKAKKVRSGGNVRKIQQKRKEPVVQPIKQNFRKQKYTKAVKNWLNNVEMHHPIDEELDTSKSTSAIEQNTTTATSDEENIDLNAHFNKSPPTHDGKNIFDKTLKSTKKVVQAQLANKDGVMKYSKLTKNGEEIKTCVDVLENRLKNSTDKKAKVKKFVAPIKSQIPVKDVLYEMRTIDEDTIEHNREHLRQIQNNEIIAVLIYSNGFCQLNSHHTDGTCAPDGIIVNNDDMFYCFKSTGQETKATLKHLFENNKVVCYGARSVLIYLADHLQMEINSFNMYDAEIGAGLLDPDNSPDNFTDLQKLLSFTAPYTIATDCTLQKSAWYMFLLKECWARLYGMLVEHSLWKVFVDIEMKLLPIIADMERRGVCIDTVKLNAMEAVLLTRMKVVEQQCYKAAGKVFQINSAAQVRAILYDELLLDTKCNVNIRETLCKGAKSTSEAVVSHTAISGSTLYTSLRSLVCEHPLPQLILEYRHLHKAHATFLTGIAQHVRDGRVRPTWVQTAAATGRIASNNPNLQAIPKVPFNLVMFPNAGDDSTNSQLMFRSVYVARAGRRLLAADFQHVECRVHAHAASCAALLRALRAGHDLFAELAAHWMNKPEAEVTAEERERTKRLVYASMYGAGTRKLMEILDVDYPQALQVAASFNRTFPSLKWFGRDVVSRCRAAGGRLASLCGRVRRFANIASEDFNLKSHAERQAVNFVVQGSAADLCKIAMILTEQQLRNSSPPVEAHLVLQIHDELVWEVDDACVARAAAIIKRAMEGCGQLCGMSVTLPVALSVGKDWGRMEPYAL